MKTKKFILTAFCVLAATVVAQNAYAQSPSMEAKFIGQIWQGAFAPKANKKAEPSAQPAEKPAEQEVAQGAGTDAKATHWYNMGKEMRIVNTAEHTQKCFGEFCKEIISSFKESVDNMNQSGVLPGPEGKKVEMGVRLYERIQQNQAAKKEQAREEQAKVDSLTKAIEKASLQAAKKAYLKEQNKK